MLLEGGLDIDNSTLAENSAGRGGGLYNEGTNSVLRLNHTTVAYNSASDNGSDLRSGGGGLNINGEIYINSSLVSLNNNNDCDLNQGMQDKGDYVICDETYCASRLLNIDSDDTCGFDIPLEPSPQLGSFTGIYVPILAGSPLIDYSGNNLCNAVDDQLISNRPQGTNCEPGSIEYVASPPSPPPPAPPPSEPSEDPGDCDPFAGMDISVHMLNINPETLILPIYLRFPSVVPDLGDGTMPYRGDLEGLGSSLCNQQGFPDRLYCMFTLQPDYPGTLRDLNFFKEDCPDPVFSQPRLTIPEIPDDQPSATCNKDLGENACKNAGGIWPDIDKPYCICP